MSKTIAMALLLIPLILTGCASGPSEQKIFVFKYSDFGPQAMAYNLLGKEWWQWDNHGDSRPSSYDIKVIVYRNKALKKVQKRYPVDEKDKQDYRYIKYQDALDYLDRHIEENLITKITQRLQKTREKLKPR